MIAPAIIPNSIGRLQQLHNFLQAFANIDPIQLEYESNSYDRNVCFYCQAEANANRGSIPQHKATCLWRIGNILAEELTNEA